MFPLKAGREEESYELEKEEASEETAGSELQSQVKEGEASEEMELGKLWIGADSLERGSLEYEPELKEAESQPQPQLQPESNSTGLAMAS